MKVSVSESGLKFLKKFHEERKMEKEIEASLDKELADGLGLTNAVSRRAGLGSIFVNSPMLRDRKSRRELPGNIKEGWNSPSSAK